MSLLYMEMCRIMGIQKARPTALHPQSHGMVERINRTMDKHLQKMVSKHQQDWDQYLHLFLLAYCSSIYETNGQTPANVLFWQELQLPCDLQFRCKLDDDVASEDYVFYLKKQMEVIHDRFCGNMLGASELMMEHYDIRAEKEVMWSCVGLYNPRRRGYSSKLQKA